MTKKFLTLALVLCLAVAPALALADSSMSVQGSATLTVSPDIAVLNVGHSTESADSTAAQQQTADVITALTSALKAAGIEDADIRTAYLNTYPVYNYTEGAQSLRGYRVEHMLSVTVRDIDKAGETLDIALKAGANQADSIQYKSTRERDVYLEALALAVEDATAKADALAIASGVWLGSLSQINEIAGYNTFRTNAKASYAMDAAEGASTGSTIMAGDLEVTASVELIYDIR